MGMKRAGTILLVIGLAFAILLGALADLFIQGVIVAFFAVLVVFGIIVGVLNSAKEETEEVLYTTAVLVLVAMATANLSRIAPDIFGGFIVGAGRGLIAYLLPVALIVGGKRIIDLGEGF